MFSSAAYTQEVSHCWGSISTPGTVVASLGFYEMIIFSSAAYPLVGNRLLWHFINTSNCSCYSRLSQMKMFSSATYPLVAISTPGAIVASLGFYKMIMFSSATYPLVGIRLLRHYLNTRNYRRFFRLLQNDIVLLCCPPPGRYQTADALSQHQEL